MHTLLVFIHVATMIGSLFVMPVAILLALRGVRTSMKLALGAVSLTSVGFLSGVILLFGAPILNECITLTAYLAAMVTIYAVGFGWGVEAKARLLKPYNLAKHL
jgi:hypothetical protein